MSKVLVIDDDPMIVAIYEKLFLAQGYEVAVANDGEQGLVAVEEFKPDVVLLDLNLPNLSGTAWLRHIRKHPGLRKLPVVVLTAGTFAVQVKSALDAGATQVLSKARQTAAQVGEAVRIALTAGSLI